MIAQSLDKNDYMVNVKMSLSPTLSLPRDSVVSIAGDGLMGDKFIKIEPGKENEKILPGSTVTNVKDAKSLEDMVGEIIFMVTGDEDK